MVSHATAIAGAGATGGGGAGAAGASSLAGTASPPLTATCLRQCHQLRQRIEGRLLETTMASPVAAAIFIYGEFGYYSRVAF